MQVAKWGNSLAVRLPAAVVEALELKEGDEIEIRVADLRQFDVARKPSREALLQSTRLAVQAEVAQTYLSLRAVDDERALIRETVAAYRAGLTLTERRYS